MKKFLAAAGLVVLCAGIAFALESAKEDGKVGEGEAPEGRVMSIEDYFKTNISALSPVKETMGGKFYVTSIEVKDGGGIVSYEDGHNAYVADFTYSSEPLHGAYSIETFTLRK